MSLYELMCEKFSLNEKDLLLTHIFPRHNVAHSICVSENNYLLRKWKKENKRVPKVI